MRHSALLPLVLLLLAAPARAGAGAREFEFPRLNRAYKDLVGEVPEYRDGSLVVRVSSPRQSLVLRSHRLRLEPLADGSYAARLTVEFFGQGWMVADLAFAGIAQRVEDEVQVPVQRIELAARVRIAVEKGGYRFVALELPRQVEVEVRSRLAGQVLALCDGAAVLALGGLDCSGVERRLTRVAAPLPGPGGEFFLAAAELGPAERAALDAFLARGR